MRLLGQISRLLGQEAVGPGQTVRLLSQEAEGPDFEAAGPDFKVAGPDFEAAGPNGSMVAVVSRCGYINKIETAT